MIRIALPEIGFAAMWQGAARRLASHGIEADTVSWAWADDAPDLFGGSHLPDQPGPTKIHAPRALIRSARAAICHREGVAPALAYRALLRHQSAPQAWANPADRLTHRLTRLAQSVRRDIHKMHAFLRFRELPTTGQRRRFGAWFEPDHRILEAAAPFFARRFADMDWLISTPQGSAAFTDGALSFHAFVARPDLPEDASETLWATYFTHIFNPARLHLKAMRSEMPVKYWKNLPETQLIPQMLQEAEGRVAKMRAAMPSEPPARAARILERLTPAPLPEPTSLDSAAQAARACTRCGLCEAASQTVWGRGDPKAGLMIVGEAPGDQEDLTGQPFVGPAGQLLQQLMIEADTGPAWLTNAVKHFKFTPRGKRRLHQSPNRGEIQKCRWWLDLERRFVAPRLTLALGASAAYALTGRADALAPRRGQIETARDGGQVLISWHPSFVLRQQGPARDRAQAELLADLRRIPALMQDAAEPAPPISADQPGEAAG